MDSEKKNKYKFEENEHSNQKNIIEVNEMLKLDGGYNPEDYNIQEIQGEEIKEFASGEKMELKEGSEFFAIHKKEKYYYVDGEKYSIDQKEMTVAEILSRAEYVPKDTILKWVVGKNDNIKKTYEDVNIVIKLHKGQKFITAKRGPTPVSDPDIATVPKFGVSNFIDYVKEKGFSDINIIDDHISFKFPVRSGKYKGQSFLVGVVVPGQYPAIAPSGIHVSPCMHTVQGGGQHPAGGIHPSESHSTHFSSVNKWHYWSRPFKGWRSSNSVDDYFRHIKQLWSSQ
jgi:hypothetical protein